MASKKLEAISNDPLLKSTCPDFSRRASPVEIYQQGLSMRQKRADEISENGSPRETKDFNCR